MQVEKNDLATLIQLQQFDLDLFRSKKKLDELPQRKRIMSLREKKREIEQRQKKVDEMRSSADHDLSRIKDEDERLVTKQQEVQRKIDESQGDYRSVEALTKELGGIAKRRNTLETDLDPLSQKVSEIEQVQKQLAEAMALVTKEENDSIASFQKEGGALNNEVARLQACRDNAAGALDAALLSTYEKKMQRCGGIAIAILQGNVCSVCRNQIDQGKLLAIRSEAPLSECPACQRMMVITNA